MNDKIEQLIIAVQNGENKYEELFEYSKNIFIDVAKSYSIINFYEYKSVEKKIKSAAIEMIKDFCFEDGKTEYIESLDISTAYESFIRGYSFNYFSNYKYKLYKCMRDNYYKNDLIENEMDWFRNDIYKRCQSFKRVVPEFGEEIEETIKYISKKSKYKSPRYIIYGVNKNKNKYGNKIRELYWAKGYTQKEVGRILGFSDGYISFLMKECFIKRRNKTSISSGEREVRNFLVKNNIKFLQEYTFADCCNICLLSFDFVVFNDNKIHCLIEYDGKQHFKPIKWFGGESNFKKQKQRDEIKNKYCEENDIKLIRIPYYNFCNIHNILKKELDDLVCDAVC